MNPVNNINEYITSKIVEYLENRKQPKGRKHMCPVNQCTGCNRTGYCEILNDMYAAYYNDSKIKRIASDALLTSCNYGTCDNLYCEQCYDRFMQICPHYTLCCSGHVECDCENHSSDEE